MTALSIRKDRTSVVLRRAAKAEKDARAARRMLAIGKRPLRTAVAVGCLARADRVPY